MPGCALGLPSPAEQRAAGIQGAYPAQWQSSSGRCQPEVGQDGAQGREVGTKPPVLSASQAGYKCVQYAATLSAAGVGPL